MTTRPARSGPIRRISIAAFLAWLFLFATSYDYFPGLSHAWGLNLLAYLPDWAAWLLTILALLVTTEEARRGLIRVGTGLGRRLRALPELPGVALLASGSFVVLWLLRDRVLQGDALLLMRILRQEGRPGFPETGSLWLMSQIHDAVAALGFGPRLGLQLVLCVAGALTVVAILRAARLAAPEARAAGAIPLLVLSGGIGAALTGRVDAQALILLAASVWFWLALRQLAGRPGRLAPPLALGVLVWLEPYTLVLLPSLLLLYRERTARSVATTLGLALLPLALHIALLLLANPRDLPAATIVARALGSIRGWVPVQGSSHLGTDYSLATAGHLKYLANSALVLAGGALLATAGVWGAERVRFWADRETGSQRWLDTPQLRFLGAATGGLVVASLAVRPVWGPWDWDLFASTALAFCLLSGAAMARLSLDVRQHIAVAVAGLQLAFFGVPVVAIGFGSDIHAGPFAGRLFDAGLPQRDREPPPRLAPWL
jgi:hypothetical protein